MRKLLAMVRIEFRNEFSSRMSWVFFLLMPILFTAAVGTSLRGMQPGEGAVEELLIPIYVRLDDRGPLVEALLGALVEANLQPQEVEVLPEAALGLEVPADFSARLVAGEAASLTLHTVANSSTSVAAEQAVMAASGRIGGAAQVVHAGLDRARATGLLETTDEVHDALASLVGEVLATTANPPVAPEVRWPEEVLIAESRDAMSSIEQASAGQLVTWVQITLLGAAEVLVSERQGGTLRRMLVMPVGRATVLGGKWLARLSLGLVQMTLLIVVGQVLFGVTWGRDPLALAVVSFSFALATSSLGMLLATFVKTPGQANSLVVGLAMTLAALGGAWFSLEVAPPLYRQVVQILPSTWAMRAYTDLLVRQASVMQILPHVAVLLGFTTLFGAIAMARIGRAAGSD